MGLPFPAFCTESRPFAEEFRSTQQNVCRAEKNRGETEFRDGEHGLTLILLEITVGGGTWKKGDYSKRELYMGVSKDICSEGLRARKAEILTWLERLFS